MAFGKRRRAIGQRPKSGQTGNNRNKTCSWVIIQPSQKRSKLDRSILHSIDGSNNESTSNINNNNDNDHERNTSIKSVMDANIENNNQPKTRVWTEYMFGYSHVQKLKRIILDKNFTLQQ